MEPDVTGSFDLASRGDQARVRAIANRLVDTDEAELRAIGSDEENGIALRLASKLALSKQALERSEWKGRIGVVFAMWGEQRRLRPRTPGNPTGEDALRAKLEQLDWALQGTGIEWHLYPVDDAGPGDFAQRLRKTFA